LPISSEDGDLAIRCEGIGKRYRIGQQVRYRTLRDAITEMARAPFRGFMAGLHSPAADDRDLWALRDLSFQVRHGEVLGIIGRNGSGKSTLLKILSRITIPSEGSAEIRGQLGTLLEVGAGFHPELTGRENILLYGAILGMSRTEIARKFDEIVEFAECGRLLDTPMKHYSSGMYVRLAFAVAAHLETQILLVDEVLAVGDEVFQKKCLGKMSDVAHQGRTVLFVSHNLLAVESLCSRAICLHEGRLVLEGEPNTVTSRYLNEWLPAFKEVVYESMEIAPGNEVLRLHRANVRASGDSPGELFTVRTPLEVEFEYWKLTQHENLLFLAEIFNQNGVNVFNTALTGGLPAETGLLRSSFRIPADLMNNGTYRINLMIFLGDAIEIADWRDLVAFEVRDAPSEMRGHYHGEWKGVVRPNIQWRTDRIGPLPDRQIVT
jgi:lipopolysaccharide transport system ATP-binding protein